MRKLFNISVLKTFLTFRDKGAFVWMFLAPLIFVTVLVLGFGGGFEKTIAKYPLSIVNNDGGYYGERVMELLRKDNTFEVKECGYDEARDDIEGGKSAMGIVIPEGFSESISDNTKPLDILKLNDNETTMAMAAVVENYLYQIKVGIRAGEGAADALASMNRISIGQKEDIKSRIQQKFYKNSDSNKISYNVKTIERAKKTGLDQLSYTAIGIMIIFIMFFVTGSAGSILEEREIGTWKRVISTPTGSFSILGGHLLGNFTLGWIQVGFLILISRYLFHINWGNSILGLFALFSSFLLAIIGLGSALASFVKTKSQLSALSPIIIMPTCLIGGCMWPTDIMSDTMVKISNFVPQSWVLKGITDLVLRGSDISAVYLPCSVLIAFAVVFFTAGLMFMNLQSNR